MKLINITPHAINLHAGENVITIPPSGYIARCDVVTVDDGTVVVDGHVIKIKRQSYGTVSVTNSAGEELALEQDALYIVSALAYAGASETQRSHFVTVTDLVRDEQGRVIGARALGR